MSTPASPAGEPGPPNPARPALRDVGFAAMVGIVGACALLSPLLGAPGSRVIGDWQSPDTLGWQSAADWMSQRLMGFAGVWHSAATYAPVGETPMGTLDGASVLFAAPLLAVLGWPLGANAYAGLVIVANTIAGAWLARSVGAGRAAALFGGVAFALSPYFIQELSAGRLGQMSAWALVCALAAGIRQVEQPSWRGAALTALFLGLAGVGYAWYGLMTAGALAFVAAVHLWREGARARANLGILLGSAVAGIAALAPGLAIAHAGMKSAAEDGVPQPLAIEFSLAPLWPFGIAGGPVVPAAIPFVLLGLALVAVATRSPRTRPLVAVGVFGWAMSLGPRLLTPGGPIVDSHFPFFVYSWVFPEFTFPYQHAVLVAAAVAALAASGATALARWIGAAAIGTPGGRVELSLCVGLAALCPMELALRGARSVPEVSHLAPEPEWASQLRELPEGTMLVLPLAPELRVSQENVLLQRVHKHPTLDGHTSWRRDRRPLAWDEMVEASGFLKELARFERGREIKGDPERANYFRYPTEDVQYLREHGLRWIVVWDPMYVDSLKGLARNERQLAEKLFGRPVVTSNGLTVYDFSAHREDGDVVAPSWRFPEGIRGGDGVHRMASILPPGLFFERATRRP
jgi:hypothetical protein